MSQMVSLPCLYTHPRGTRTRVRALPRGSKRCESPRKGRVRVQLGATGMWCGPCAAMESTSVLRGCPLPAGDTNEGDASTPAREPACECRSNDGVDEPWQRQQLVGPQMVSAILASRRGGPAGKPRREHTARNLAEWSRHTPISSPVICAEKACRQLLPSSSPRALSAHPAPVSAYERQMKRENLRHESATRCTGRGRRHYAG